MVKTGTLIEATVLASASKGDREACWVGHRCKKPVHGYKARVAIDAEMDIARAAALTTVKTHDLIKAEEVLLEDAGDVYADTASAAHRFEEAITARGGGQGSCSGPLGVKDRSAPERPDPVGRLRIEKTFGTWKRSCGLCEPSAIWGSPGVVYQDRLAAIIFKLKRIRNQRQKKTLS
jgi:IS5 family transposase